MGVIADTLKRNLDVYYSSSERTIDLLTKENDLLKAEIKLLQRKLNQQSTLLRIAYEVFPYVIHLCKHIC